MTIDDLLLRLEAVRPRARGYVARCPAHADRHPSLSISQGERGILLKCWSGCELREITAAVGIRPADLFADASLPRGQRPEPRPAKIDRVAHAFQFDVGALDLRLRAERIIEAGKKLDVTNLSDSELDHALIYAAQAHADMERAELFEYVADDLRARDFSERKKHERQTRVA